jgi:serine O-acetyltransferase
LIFTWVSLVKDQIVIRSKVNIPEKKGVEILVKKIFRLIFPFEGDLMLTKVTYPGKSILEMADIISRGDAVLAESIGKNLFNNLSSIKEMLIRDAIFILDSDPAARSLEEVVAIYPGFFAIYCHRIAHELYNASVPILPRMITEYAHKITGIDIHPGATIGCPFSIDHGTGIVIGETTLIGDNVKLYQGVTLGALSVDKRKASTKRHPTIEDNAILYAGCTILGGDTVIGRNSIVGGNVWLTESIPPYSVAYHKSQIIVRDQSTFEEPLNFII